MNLGQLAMLLRAKYLKDIVSYNKVEGKPFYRFEVLAKIQEVLRGTGA
jgi:2-oxoglutarate ferredoxin oxidoreductase subunit alpha